MKTTLVLVLMAAGTAANAQVLTETFDDPLGDWNNRWLYQNSDMENYYIASGSDPDPNYRGNNPEGLWIASPQGFGNGDFDSELVVTFDSAFGATITDIEFGLECFINTDITAYDMSGNSLGTLNVPGTGGFDFDHIDVYSASSNNGVSRIVLVGSGQVSGNTSIDNVSVTVPAPGALALLGLGGLATARRRR